MVLVDGLNFVVWQVVQELLMMISLGEPVSSWTEKACLAEPRYMLPKYAKLFELATSVSRLSLPRSIPAK